MRWVLLLLLPAIFLAAPVNASMEAIFTIEEDSSFRSERTLNEMWGLKNDTEVGVASANDNISVKVVDGYLNITASNNWFGQMIIGYAYIEDGIATDGGFLVNVTNVNDLPLINDVVLSGDPAQLINPVSARVDYTDVDGDQMDITWYLDEEEIGKEENFQRYIYPDQNNLTVVIDDGNGGVDTRSIDIHTVPPEGWGEEADNTMNRIIFWTIFGSAGAILLAAMVWVLFNPEKKNS